MARLYDTNLTAKVIVYYHLNKFLLRFRQKILNIKIK